MLGEIFYITEYAQAVASKGICCTKSCLRKIDMFTIISIVTEAQTEMQGMNKEEKRAFIRLYTYLFTLFVILKLKYGLSTNRNKVESCIVDKYEKSGYFKMNYRIGSIENKIIDNVCIESFRMVHNITKGYLENTIRMIKNGTKNSDRAFNDRSVTATALNKEVINMLKRFNLELSQKQLGAMNMPNTPIECNAYGWMDYYFNTVGDLEPNTNGEIHLGKLLLKIFFTIKQYFFPFLYTHVEPCHIKDIHSEYKLQMSFFEDDVLDIASFANLWNSSFP